MDGHRVVPALGGLLVIGDQHGREVTVGTGHEAIEVLANWSADALEAVCQNGIEELEEELPGFRARVLSAVSAVERPAEAESLAVVEAFALAVSRAAEAVCHSEDERALLGIPTSFAFTFTDSIDLAAIGATEAAHAEHRASINDASLLRRAGLVLAIVVALVVLWFAL